jgi:hypothetical protein
MSQINLTDPLSSQNRRFEQLRDNGDRNEILGAI